MGPHDKFLELCAISTSGELTGEEQKDLQAHLAECADCWQALKEFEAAAGIGMLLLHSDPTSADSSEPSTNSTEASTTAHTRAVAPIETAQTDRATSAQSSGLKFPPSNRPPSHAGELELRVDAICSCSGAYGRIGHLLVSSGQESGQVDLRTTPSATDTRVEALERSISDAGHDREVLKAQLADRDRMIAELRSQIADQSASLNETKSARVNLEQSLHGEEAEKQQVAQERSTLSQQLDAAQTSLRKTQAELDSLWQQRSQDQSRADSLEAQIRDLHGQLRDREQDLGKQQELLAHDGIFAN
jgi:peptidoglycan hydrolase CwlO-like protein